VARRCAHSRGSDRGAGVGVVFADVGLRNVTVPVQLWRAASDSDAPNATNSDALAAGLPRTPEMHTVPLAGHFVFLATVQ